MKHDISEEKFDRVELVATRIVRWATASHVLILIVLVLLIWLGFGIMSDFSEQWQSVMVIPVTVITFLLVFLILRAQNKDTRAIQLKLNEIIAALDGANNQLIDIENKSELEIEEVHQKYEAVAELVQQEPAALATEAISVADLADEIISTKEGDGSASAFTPPQAT